MTNQTENNPKRPTHTVYSVKTKENEKSDWIKVGAAWLNTDGKGLNLSLEILGQKVSVTVRENKPKPE